MEIPMGAVLRTYFPASCGPEYPSVVPPDPLSTAQSSPAIRQAFAVCGLLPSGSERGPGDALLSSGTMGGVLTDSEVHVGRSGLWLACWLSS